MKITINLDDKKHADFIEAYRLVADNLPRITTIDEMNREFFMAGVKDFLLHCKEHNAVTVTDKYIR